jgi:TatD DNase family protein
MKHGKPPGNSSLFNAHTHKIVPNELSVFQKTKLDTRQIYTFFSIGIHPEQATVDSIILNKLFRSALHPFCLAIGETGLDKRYPNVATQETCFIAQLKLAQNVRKPVILHCVSEWDRCRKLHHTFAPETPLIYHGFAKPSILERVLNYPKVFVSLGEQLMFSKPLQLAVKEIPLNRIFLETDDADVDLMELYEKLAEIKSLPLPAITEQLYLNFLEVFHHGKLA